MIFHVALIFFSFGATHLFYKSIKKNVLILPDIKGYDFLCEGQKCMLGIRLLGYHL